MRTLGQLALALLVTMGLAITAKCLNHWEPMPPYVAFLYGSVGWIIATKEERA